MELMKWYRGNGWRWVGKTIPGRGAVSGCSSPPGWSWLDDLGDGVNCFVFFFSYLLKIHGDWWLRDLFCLLQGAVKAPRLGSEFHSAFWNIIPVTTPIELRRLLMLPRRKERGETSPKILLNCWVGVVKIPLCSDGLENVVKCSKIEKCWRWMEKSSWNCWVGVVKIPLCFVGWGRGELKENWIMLEVNQKVLLKWRIGMSQETPELFTGEQGGRA